MNVTCSVKHMYRGDSAVYVTRLHRLSLNRILNILIVWSVPENPDLPSKPIFHTPSVRNAELGK